MAETGLDGLVRAADPDRYLSVLYAPANKRADLFALYAFNAEVARIRDIVSEPMPGEIRLQWWREAVAGERAGEAAANPVAAALIGAIERHHLPRATLDNMLQARLFDLYDDPMPDRATLEGYCGETAGAMIQLASMVLAGGDVSAHGAAAGHAACAQAITGLIRLAPLHRARGQCYVPAEILAAAGLDRAAWLAGAPREGVAVAIAALAALAREHLMAHQAVASELPAAVRPAYLPLAPVHAYLDRIDKAAAQAAFATADIGPLHRNWLFVRAALRGRTG